MRCKFALLLFALIVIGSPLAWAQQRGWVPVRNCMPIDLDESLWFGEGPVGVQSVVRTYRNISASPCKLSSTLPTWGFAVDGHSMMVDYCQYCVVDEGSPRRVTPDDELHRLWAVQKTHGYLLERGEAAHVSTSWRSIGGACKAADWIGPVCSTPWKIQLCSAAYVSGYEKGAVGPEDGLELTAPPAPIYSDEEIELRIAVKPEWAANVEPSGCADVFSTTRNYDGSTRFDVLRPNSNNSNFVNLFTIGERNCNDPNGAVSMTVLIGADRLAHTTRVLWRGRSAADASPVWLAARASFTVLDPATLDPHWGVAEAGIRAGLSVDADSFNFGDQIPLHLLWENVAATEPLGVSEFGEPPSVEIQDAEHRVVGVIPTEELMGGSGHGWGPFSIPAGKINRLEVGLFAKSGVYRQGFWATRGHGLIARPGSYYLSVTWSPHRLLLGEGQTDGGIDAGRSGSSLGAIYGTVRSSSVNIEILP